MQSVMNTNGGTNHLCENRIKIYHAERERERERVRKGGGVREGGREEVMRKRCVHVCVFVCVVLSVCENQL